MPNSYILSINRTLSGATIPSQSGQESNGNKWLFCVPQSFSITEATPLDCLVSYQDTRWGESYSSTEIWSLISTAPADWAS